MVKNLAKIQKKVAKKKGNVTSLHENSRDSQRIRRASGREDKLARLSSTRAKLNQPYCEFVLRGHSAGG
jgi:translation machinery-associated protein 16